MNIRKEIEEMKMRDYTTHIAEPEDVPYLRTKLLDVNIRLLRSSSAYRDLVTKACAYIAACCLRKSDDYPLPYGFSGANAGIPWNIIGVVRNRGTREADVLVMVNPTVIRASNETVQASSNCGSLQLKDSIRVLRPERILVQWYELPDHWNADRDGVDKKIEWFDRTSGGLTIQHEIDHNLGILITDREIRE